MRPSLTSLYELLERSLGFQGWWPLISRGGRPDHDEGGYRRLRDTAHTLTDDDRFEIAVGAVLTQNTTWENAKRALTPLHHFRLLSASALLSLSQPELARLIRSCGYHNQKAKKLQLLSLQWDEIRELRADPDRLRERLLAVWGIGPETADSILLYAFDHPYFVVDAYARRILTRVGFPEGAGTYEKLQRLVHDEIGRDEGILGELHALLVALGKSSCRPQPLCAGCALRGMCDTGRKTDSRLRL